MPLEVIDVSYTYNENLPQQHKALQEVNLCIPDNAFVAVVGHTGSGKSTLMQLLNGILQPTQGKILLDGEDVNAKEFPKKKLRQQVGLVFQYPEHQLFEETVLKDVAFGPKNLGLDAKEVDTRVINALGLVGLEDEAYHHVSPFNLSGGEKRRAAIAGVLAMQPRFLILDEPTAGLDPKGRDEIMQSIYKLQRSTGISIVLVTHGMEEVVKYASEVHVLNSGKIILSGKPLEVFAQTDLIAQAGLSVPAAADIISKLRKQGVELPLTLTLEQAAAAIAKAWGK